MKHLSRSLVLVAMCIMEGTAVAAETTSSRVQLENELRFESEEVASLSGWRAGGANVQLTDELVKDGRYGARVSHSSSAFGGIMKSIERDFVGDTLAIRGWIRADAGEIPVVWLRSDGIDAPVDYANSASSQTGRKPIPSSRIFRAASRTEVCGATHSMSVFMISLRRIICSSSIERHISTQPRRPTWPNGAREHCALPTPVLDSLSEESPDS